MENEEDNHDVPPEKHSGDAENLSSWLKDLYEIFDRNPDRELFLGEIIDDFFSHRMEFNGRAVDPSDVETKDEFHESLSQVLGIFRRLKLINFELRKRKRTKNVGFLMLPEDVYSANRRGRKILSWSKIGKRSYFYCHILLLKFSINWWPKIRPPITAFATIFTICRMVIQLADSKAAILAFIGAVIAAILTTTN